MSEMVTPVRPPVLRPATAADLSAVLALLGECDLPVDGVADQFEDGYVIAEEDAELIGVAGLEVYGGHGLLRSVAVAQSARGRGVAALLVADRVEWARARGLRAVYLLTTTAESWFARHSFTTIARDDVPSSICRSAEFADICPSSAAAMELRLEPRASSCCGAPVLLSAQPATAASASSCCGPSASLADADSLKANVREKYGAAAVRAAGGAKSSCCGTADDEVWDPITADLYDAAEAQDVPAEAMLASLGCGNPTALAQLHAGDTVLDLGSGGGIDVLLSARRVGPTGKVYGLDMTDEMLELARANQARAGATNVEFLKGDIESIPLPDDSVDVIISNCVINLAADKGRVLREAFRVLRPGGRFAVSDVVARKRVPDAIRRSMELWMGCVAGALHEDEYARLLREAGFDDVALEPTRVYGGDDARWFLEGAGLEVPDRLDEYDGAFMSAFVRARKPAAAG
jgi:arsenite methyltransferase